MISIQPAHSPQAVDTGQVAIKQHQQQHKALLYLSLATIGMILLAASLQGLQLQAGLPVPGAESASPAAPAVQTGAPAVQATSPWLLQAALAVGILAFILALVIALWKRIPWKRVGLLAAGLVILYALFSQLPRLEPAQADSLHSSPFVTHLPAFVYAAAPIGRPPAGLITWVTAGLLLTAAGLCAWLLSRAFRGRQNVDPLAREAAAAAQAIAEGQNLKNVIVRCYLRMERAIAEEQGIERENAMTAREFENHLVGKGIPRTPVVQLTRLFEKARYGSQALDPRDEQAALDCLLAIRSAFRPGQRRVQ